MFKHLSSSQILFQWGSFVMVNEHCNTCHFTILICWIKAWTYTKVTRKLYNAFSLQWQRRRKMIRFAFILSEWKRKSIFVVYQKSVEQNKIGSKILSLTMNRNIYWLWCTKVHSTKFRGNKKKIDKNYMSS